MTQFVRDEAWLADGGGVEPIPARSAVAHRRSVRSRAHQVVVTLACDVTREVAHQDAGMGTDRDSCDLGALDETAAPVGLPHARARSAIFA